MKLPRRRLISVALATAVLGVIAPGDARAVARPATVATDVASVTGAGGTTVNVTAGVPVAAAGTVSQTITQSFDPSRARLTGSSGIVAPAGWTLTYSSDGVTFGAAPGSPAGWAAIRAVRATGSIDSGGDSNGLQIASGTGTGTVPPSGTFASGGGGDGWDVAFDMQGNVYNTFHHDGYWGSGFITPGLHCHTRTGATCGPGWPFALRIPNGTNGPEGISGQPWYHTNDQAMEWVDTANNRVWIPTSMNDGTAATGLGYVCVDVSDLAVGPAWCGGTIRNAFVRLSTTACGRDCNIGLVASNSMLFSLDAVTGKLLCLDPYTNRAGGLPGSPCASQPFAITGLTSASFSNGYSMVGANGLVWAAAESKGYCFNPSTMAACSGWTGGAVSIAGTSPNMSFYVPTSTGAAGSVCFTRYDTVRACFSADGTSSTALSGSYVGSALMTYLTSKVTATTLPKSAETNGTRIYWADGAWPGGGKVYCWDTSLSSGTGAACGNWPVNVSTYTATIDTQNPNCIWTNTDSGTITTIDAITGGATCTTPPPLAEFSAPVILPRIACTGASSIQSWRSLELTAPLASTYSTAKLTVLTATGQVVPGWSQVSVPAGNRTVDLSSLSVAASGTSPRFKIFLNDKTTNDLISAKVSAVGDAPQLCLPLQTVIACPTAPARIAGSLAAPAPITVTATGTAQPGSGPVEQFSTSSANVTVSTPSATDCLGTITGTATMASNSAVVANATVRLLDPSGAVVATATTDANGNYTFDRLVAAAGYTVSFGPSSQGAADNSTVSSASTSRTVTANATTTVNGTYAHLRTNALSGSAAHGQPVTVTPAPNDSTDTQSYASFTKSATCIIDPADLQCKSSVTVAGQGTWTAGAATGALTFTPVNGYSGTTTALDYRVTETSTSWTTWNTAQATIAPAPTTTTSTSTTTTTVAVAVAQSSSVTPSAPVSVARTTSLSVLSTRVSVPSAGRVTQTGTAAAVVVCTASPVTVRSAGAVSTNCALTWAVRQQLRMRAVTVTLVTKFKGKDGTTRVTRTKVTLPRRSMLPVTR